MFTQIKLAIIFLTLSGLYFYIGSLKTQITKLETKVSQWQVNYANEKIQSALLRNSVKTQNSIIEGLRIDEQLAQEKLTAWQDKPPVNKYKTIIKVREVTSDRCTDIKSVLGIVRHIDFNNL